MTLLVTLGVSCCSRGRKIERLTTHLIALDSLETNFSQELSVATSSLEKIIGITAVTQISTTPSCPVCVKRSNNWASKAMLSTSKSPHEDQMHRESTLDGMKPRQQDEATRVGRGHDAVIQHMRQIISTTVGSIESKLREEVYLERPS